MKDIGDGGIIKEEYSLRFKDNLISKNWWDEEGPSGTMGVRERRTRGSGELWL